MCLVRLETRRPDILDVQLQVNNTSVDLPVRSGLACRRAFAVKLLSLAAAACLLLAEPARAAERPVPTKSWRPPACITNWWQGWYLGINGAAGGYSGYRTDQDAQLNLANPVTYTQKQSGIFGGGGQLGYNWTTCHGLLGIEIDGDDGSMAVSTGVLPNSAFSNASVTSRVNALVTGRARAGIVGDDAWLLYA